MAKRRKHRRIIEQTKTQVISCGVSLLIHCIIILFLSLLFEKIEKHKIVKLTVNFNTPLDEKPVELDYKFDNIEPQILDNRGIIDEILPNINNNISITPDPLEIETKKVDNDTAPVEAITETVESIPEPTKSPVEETDIFGLPIKKFGKFNNDANVQASSAGLSGKTEGVFCDRLKKRGAQTGDVQISIMWETTDDVDLWVEYVPFSSNNRKTINWITPINTNGMLDVDCNVSPTTNQPVENVFWPYNQAPFGTYNVYIHYFQQWTNHKTLPVKLRIVIDGKIEYRKIVVQYGSHPLKSYSFVRKVKKLDPTSQ